LFFVVASEVELIAPDLELVELADELFLATAFELLLDVEFEFADDEAELLPEELLFAVAPEVVEVAPDLELVVFAEELFLAIASALFEVAFAADEAELLSEELFVAVASEVEVAVPDLELVVLVDELFLATASALFEVAFAADDSELLPEELFFVVASEVELIAPDLELVELADELFLATASALFFAELLDLLPVELLLVEFTSFIDEELVVVDLLFPFSLPTLFLSFVELLLLEAKLFSFELLAATEDPFVFVDLC
jgi:hypothetical protein